MATIQGKDIKVQLRESGTTGSYKTLICETSSSVNIALTNTQTVTKCATYTSVSNPTFTFPVEGVIETSPSATELSYSELMSYIVNATLLDIKVENPAGGAEFYVQGQCYVTDLNMTAPAEGLATFSGTITGTGVFDITA